MRLYRTAGFEDIEEWQLRAVVRRTSQANRARTIVDTKGAVGACDQLTRFGAAFIHIRNFNRDVCDHSCIAVRHAHFQIVAGGGFKIELGFIGQANFAVSAVDFKQAIFVAGNDLIAERIPFQILRHDLGNAGA